MFSSRTCMTSGHCSLWWAQFIQLIFTKRNLQWKYPRTRDKSWQLIVIHWLQENRTRTKKYINILLLLWSSRSHIAASSFFRLRAGPCVLGREREGRCARRSVIKLARLSQSEAQTLNPVRRLQLLIQNKQSFDTSTTTPAYLFQCILCFLWSYISDWTFVISEMNINFN